jgi:hypothetical protein
MMLTASRLAVAPPEPDPLFSQVKLLVRADTNFADSSSMARAVTNVGGVGIVAGAGLGAGAASFTVAGQRLDYAATDTAMDLPAGDFTIELGMTPAAFSGADSARNVVSRNVSGNGWRLGVGELGTVTFVAGWAGGTSTFMISSSQAWTNGTRYHLAVTRQGTTYRIFRDGALVHTRANEARTIGTNANAPIQVGGQTLFSSSSTPFALIDNLRITVGTARYTAAFTPPTAPFPDS